MKTENEWVDKIYKLMDAVDGYIPIPTRQQMSSSSILQVLNNGFFINSSKGNNAKPAKDEKFGSKINDTASLNLRKQRPKENKKSNCLIILC